MAEAQAISGSELGELSLLSLPVLLACGLEQTRRTESSLAKDDRATVPIYYEARLAKIFNVVATS